MEVFDRIKEVRCDHGYSRRSVADIMSISESHYGNVETGRVKISKSFIYTFCNEFNVNKEWLLSGIGSKYLTNTNVTINPELKDPIRDAWNTSLGYLWKYARIADELSYSCDFDEVFNYIVDNGTLMMCMNFIISEFIYPSDGQVSEEYAKEKLGEFLNRFFEAFPEYHHYTNKLIRSPQKRKQREEHLKSKEIWKDIKDISVEVLCDPASVGLEKCAEIENRVLSHKIYVKKDQ